jgi:DNA-directed RNA polymerase specialized sigma24 family protein
MADDRGLDMGALYVRHRDELLAFFVRRTSDTEVALDLWGETFAQVLAGRGRFRGATEEEAGAWLYGIARRQLARYYRRGSAERRAMTRLGIERPTINPHTEAEMNRPGAVQCSMASKIITKGQYSTSISYGSHLATPKEEVPSSEFGRFEGLARKLVQTPKPEVDEQREKS